MVERNNCLVIFFPRRALKIQGTISSILDAIHMFRETLPSVMEEILVGG